jgi:hypothetical protein
MNASNAAPAGEALMQNLQMERSFCEAEANVAGAPAGFGHDALLVIAPPAHPLGTGSWDVRR